MSQFKSLCWALGDWFNKPLNELPPEAHQRIQKDFSPLPWDDLSPQQRRRAAELWDAAHDPANASENQRWWDFYCRMADIQKQIATWEQTHTPNASDLAQKEKRLDELKTQLAAMQAEERRAGIVGPLKHAQEATQGASGETAYIPYPKALSMLTRRLKATPEEMAAWIFYGPELGGLHAYRNANELSPPPPFYFEPFMSEDYIAEINACWFSEEQIFHFQPQERYITGAALVERWSVHPGIRPQAYIKAKIEESRLLGLHPTRVDPNFMNDPHYTHGDRVIYSLNHVLQIEQEDELIVSLPHTHESPDERKAKLQAVYDEEAKKSSRGALKRAANRSGIARQTLREILNR